MKVLIDADACPKSIKELIFKSSLKNKIKVFVVANSYQTVPASSLIELIVVEQGPDVADRWILDHVGKSDLVVSQDIPLAAEAVDKGALVITPYGRIYDESNVKEALATRNLLMELRQGGQQLGTQKPFGPKEREIFANSYQKWASKWAIKS